MPNLSGGGKGTHKAINRFRSFIYKTGKNNTKTCWVLKCDIKKFFASIDHSILKNILKEYIPDKRILWVLGEIIDSFNSNNPGVGLPLGNLTSQFFANIYMNSFDQFVKHKLKGKYYIRYSDDFVLLDRDKMPLHALIPKIDNFLKNNLNLLLHPDKIFVKTIFSGIDFLGWIHFPDHKVVRTATKRRILKRLKESPGLETIQSYLGLLKHGNTLKLRNKFLSICKML